MKITKMTYFVKGIVDILLSLLFGYIIIKNHYNNLLPRFIIVIMLLCLGISEIIYSIETKKQRLKRKEELEALAKLYGWNKKEDEE